MKSFITIQDFLMTPHAGAQRTVLANITAFAVPITYSGLPCERANGSVNNHFSTKS